MNLTQHQTLLSPHSCSNFFQKITQQNREKKKQKFHKNLNQQEFGKKFESEKLVERRKKKIINLKLPLGINKMSEENLIKRNIKEKLSSKELSLKIYATK